MWVGRAACCLDQKPATTTGTLAHRPSHWPRIGPHPSGALRPAPPSPRSAARPGPRVPALLTLRSRRQRSPQPGLPAAAARPEHVHLQGGAAGRGEAARKLSCAPPPTPTPFGAPRPHPFRLCSPEPYRHCTTFTRCPLPLPLGMLAPARPAATQDRRRGGATPGQHLCAHAAHVVRGAVVGAGGRDQGQRVPLGAAG